MMKFSSLATLAVCSLGGGGGGGGGAPSVVAFAPRSHYGHHSTVVSPPQPSLSTNTPTMLNYVDEAARELDQLIDMPGGGIIHPSTLRADDDPVVHQQQHNYRKTISRIASFMVSTLARFAVDEEEEEVQTLGSTTKPTAAVFAPPPSTASSHSKPPQLFFATELPTNDNKQAVEAIIVEAPVMTTSNRGPSTEHLAAAPRNSWILPVLEFAAHQGSSKPSDSAKDFFWRAFNDRKLLVLLLPPSPTAFFRRGTKKTVEEPKQAVPYFAVPATAVVEERTKEDIRVVQTIVTRVFGILSEGATSAFSSASTMARDYAAKSSVDDMRSRVVVGNKRTPAPPTTDRLEIDSVLLQIDAALDAAETAYGTSLLLLKEEEEDPPENGVAPKPSTPSIDMDMNFDAIPLENGVAPKPSTPSIDMDMNFDAIDAILMEAESALKLAEQACQ